MAQLFSLGLFAHVNKKIPSVLVISILAPILVAMGCWIIFGETSISQSYHMKLAREFLPVITPAVDSHKEFHDVRVQVWTGAGGGLIAVGTVETEQQRSELRNIIAATKPPVVVSYMIKVLPTNSDVKP